MCLFHVPICGCGNFAEKYCTNIRCLKCCVRLCHNFEFCDKGCCDDCCLSEDNNSTTFEGTCTCGKLGSIRCPHRYCDECCKITGCEIHQKCSKPNCYKTASLACGRKLCGICCDGIKCKVHQRKGFNWNWYKKFINHTFALFKTIN